MRLPSVVLDFYDDPNGSFLKLAFPTLDEVPEAIKEAHILSPDERQILRDEAFALVVQDEGRIFRKFACVDAGNTMLSILYFAQNYEQMPAEAIKVAAANLINSCEEFGIEVPDVIKTAAKTPVRRRDPMDVKSTTDEQDWSQRTNLTSVQGGVDAGQVAGAASQMKTAEAKQGGDVGTDDSKKTTGGNPTGTNKKVLKVTKMNASVSAEDSTAAGSLPVNPRMVDVTGKKPVLKVKKAGVTHAALGRYPLDTFQQVEQAIDYWNQHWPSFHPDERHLYATKTAARAHELGIDVPDDLERYGSHEYAPDIEAHLASRRAVVPKQAGSLYLDLQEKRASISPESFADILGTLDREFGLDQYYGGQIQDPYFSTFGGAGKAKTASWRWQSKLGSSISAEDLSRLAREDKAALSATFSPEIAEAFSKDPLTIFESLPNDSKEILARLASR